MNSMEYFGALLIWGIELHYIERRPKESTGAFPEL